MSEIVPLRVIAHIRSEFPEKFGIPRQSGLVESLRADIIFEPEYRNAEALRGLEEFSHIWLLWQFSALPERDWSPTVRPPRLGGNTRMGVFATRSPFRPNAIGLSAVRLEGVTLRGPEGPTLQIAGADLLDGTPIFDIKPYLPYTDAHPQAACGFVDRTARELLAVDCPAALLETVPAHQRDALLAVLAQDPRPAYQRDPERVYSLRFSTFNIRFTVEETRLRVWEITALKKT